MSDAPERIWIEDEFGDGDEDQWTYGTWDVRNYRGYDVEYIRADIVQTLTTERDRLREALTEWDALIEHQYSGSREAMSAMTSVAQRTAKLLKGKSNE